MTLETIARRPAPAARREARFDFLRYGSVWEDADVLCEALAPSARNARVLSIASAGDNVLALLTLDPAEVVAADLNPAQLAALELRLAAFRALDYDELLRFLGVHESSGRATVYRRLRRDLSAGARAFWDARAHSIERGVIRAGRFERFFAIFRRFVLPLIHDDHTVYALLRERGALERIAFYRRTWDTARWRALFRVFFSRFVLGRLGRDPAFFAHVDGPVAERILSRSEYALTRLPTHDNPYLRFILTGSYAEGALPRYLRPEHFESIRSRLRRVTPFHGPAHDAPGSYDAFNLSDIFEYMAPADHGEAYGALVERARRGARLCYWNLLAPRAIPAEWLGAVLPLRAFARELHARDRAWFYGDLHVDLVTEGA